MRIAVVGAGVVGLATATELLDRGHEVRCYEADTPMAARSVGDTRIFRLLHQRPELVDWAARARERWRAWGERAGRPLVGDEGAVVGGDIGPWTAAMSAAGAPFEVTDTRPELPAAAPGGPFLLDPGGGVVRAADTGRFLLDVVGAALVGEAVADLRVSGGLVEVASTTGTATFDAAVVAAGAGTAGLAAPLGVAVPDALVHHHRFTFPLRDPARVPPAWIDRSASWRPGFGSYGQLAGPGRWAIGAHADQLDESWESGREAVELRSRQLVTAYVQEYVTGALPEVVETVYCAAPPGLGDGVSAAVAGPVVVVWGDNLFKFAPVLGAALADAALDRELPAALRVAAGG
ncbi:FAD-dependent oxidoreductase [Pseudonocardia humida]|uniref:FAD-dependent oxidoreductase n=1 Tax=Pseudonocardia humida TaxID=2800819 RepID=A0ABT1A839_9PSEU|nr:FAD-dependent oxidoreductase [Pseudonocardia humida]MCO1659126.1 FAD-dependent oxidoreductase [Pseudonocardia humida]